MALKRGNQRRTLVIHVSLAALAACGSMARVPPSTRPMGDAEVARDTAIIAAVIRSVPRGPATEVRVDPRVFTDDPSATYPVAENLRADPGSLVRARAALIRREGWTAADAPSDYWCAGRGSNPGPRPPGAEPTVPDTMSRRIQACRALGEYATYSFGIPRPGGAFFPPKGVDERAEIAGGRRWAIRAVVTSPSSRIAFDFIVEREGTHGWRVVERRLLEGIAS